MSGNELSKTENGFTLIELLIVIVISAVMLAAFFSSFSSFTNQSSKEMVLDTINADVKLTQKLMEKDFLKAGYSLPKNMRVASHFTCMDDNICKPGTDRIFVADGNEILTDMTDNNEEDGRLDTAPTTNASASAEMTELSNNMFEDDNGYWAVLTSPATENTDAIVLDSLNINGWGDNDFKEDSAVILASSATNSVSGYRVSTVDAASGTVMLKSNDKTHNVNDRAVPAVVYYVQEDPDGKTYPDGTPIFWLYRNESRVMRYVDNLRIQYGYDARNNGVEWHDTVPPTALIDGDAFDFIQLRAISVTLTIRFPIKDRIQVIPYTSVTALRD